VRVKVVSEVTVGVANGAAVGAADVDANGAAVGAADVDTCTVCLCIFLWNIWHIVEVLCELTCLSLRM